MLKHGKVLIGILFLMLAGCSFGGAPPTVIIDSPPSGTLVNLGNDVQAQVTASDADGEGVARVDLQVNGVVVQTSQAPGNGQANYSVLLTWTPTEIGTYTLTAIAYRADGTASEPASVIVEIVGEGESTEGNALLEENVPSDDGTGTDAGTTGGTTGGGTTGTGTTGGTTGGGSTTTTGGDTSGDTSDGGGGGLNLPGINLDNLGGLFGGGNNNSNNNTNQNTNTNTNILSDTPTPSNTPPSNNNQQNPTATFTPSYTPPSNNNNQQNPTPTYTPSYTPTTPPAAQVAPEDANFNNPLNIQLDSTSSVLDFISYPGGDNEDKVRYDIIGMNNNPSLSGGRARLVISASCFGSGTNFVQFFTGGQTYSCGSVLVDQEVTANSKTGTITITAVGGEGTYVQWVLTGTATRVN